jgi:hypothetical protein
VTDAPELLRLAEEVRQSGKPRLLRRGGQDLAILSPIGPASRRSTRKAKAYTRADDDAFLAAAGAWTDFDLEGYLKNNEESRRRSRPPVEL